MRFHILSDLHMEFKSWFAHPTQVDADAVILAGDIHTSLNGLAWAEETFRNIPVIYVPGNHEYYNNSFEGLSRRLSLGRPGVTVLNPGKTKVGNVTILGATLWTDYDNDISKRALVSQQINDYYLIEGLRGLQGTQKLASVNAKEKAFLKEELAKVEGPTIVVTHTSPSSLSTDEKYKGSALNCAFVDSGWEDLLSSGKGPDLWIHGHMHNSSDYTIGKTRILCNPRGYPHERNPSFNPDLVVSL